MEMLLVQRLGARCGVERPVCQDGEWAMRAPHALDSIEDVMEGDHGNAPVLCRGDIAQLLGGKAIGPVKSADRVYREDRDFLVWHVGRVVSREIRDRSGELDEGRRTK